MISLTELITKTRNYHKEKNQETNARKRLLNNRPLSLGGHVESQENKKLCFRTAGLGQTRIQCETCRAKTKLFILLTNQNLVIFCLMVNNHYFSLQRVAESLVVLFLNLVTLT